MSDYFSVKHRACSADPGHFSNISCTEIVLMTLVVLLRTVVRFLSRKFGYSQFNRRESGCIVPLLTGILADSDLPGQYGVI